MSSIYDEVHREAMADRRNGYDEVEPDRPDPSEYADLSPLNARQFVGSSNYEPGPDDPF